MAGDGARLRGRKAQAALNDEAILAAAREVFLADPAAPIAAVAERAGVGIGALYHRYDSKEELLRTLCANGQQVYVAEIEKALTSDGEPWEVFTDYLRRIVAANTHGLTVRLAGLFTPSAEQMAVAERMQALSMELFERVRAAGQLRADVTFLDIEYLLEFLAGVRLGDAQRSAELRQRHLSVIIDGLRSPPSPQAQPTQAQSPQAQPARGQPGLSPLPGQPPTWEEQTARWITQ